jgi:plastocyanin
LNNKRINVILFVVLALVVYFPSQVFAGRITGAVKVNGLRSPANILVYIAKAPSEPLDASKATFVMDQRNLTFIPHVLPIPEGVTVDFPNNDNVNHNVFSLSRAKKFNLGSYPRGQSKKVTFDAPGIVELRCDVHAEMAAYILVMKNPYFAVTDSKGRFTIPDVKYMKQHGITGIKDLPAGKYVLKNWHEKLKTKRTRIEVPKDGKVSVQLHLGRGVPSVLYK